MSHVFINFDKKACFFPFYSQMEFDAFNDKELSDLS